MRVFVHCAALLAAAAEATFSVTGDCVSHETPGVTRCCFHAFGLWRCVSDTKCLCHVIGAGAWDPTGASENSITGVGAWLHAESTSTISLHDLWHGKHDLLHDWRYEGGGRCPCTGDGAAVWVATDAAKVAHGGGATCWCTHQRGCQQVLPRFRSLALLG